MAKFVYRLQNILDIKLKLESQARTNFATAAARVNMEEEKLKKVIADKNNYIDEYRKKSLGILNVMELKHMNEGIAAFDLRIKIQKANLAAANKALEGARIKLNDAMQDRKTHEKLKEKAFEEFKQEINASEKKEIDELVSFKYNDNDKAGVN